MTGKMKGVHSLSTSVRKNSHCKAQRNRKNWICHKCFAAATLRVFKAAGDRYDKNYDILTTQVIQEEKLPTIKRDIFRFESFGDLENVTQYDNYARIAALNPDCTFALWSKHPEIIAKSAIKKPDNLVIIYSSPIIDHAVSIDTIKKVYPFIDKVFTVYSKEKIENENISINCGARSCNTCRRCYSKRTARQINEQLK